MNIEWTKPAVGDLRTLRAYIAERNPRAAEDVALKILDGVERLGTYPASGRPGMKPDTRELAVPSTPYIVVYRVQDEYVEILRVIHGSRKWP